MPPMPPSANLPADVTTTEEAQTGLDLGDEDFETEADLLAHVRERLQAKSAENEAEAPPPPPPKRQSAAQKKRAAEREAVAAAAKQSLREVFRKLASSLHPDRAEDEADALSGFRLNAAPRHTVALGQGGVFTTVSLDDEAEAAEDLSWEVSGIWREQ